MAAKKGDKEKVTIKAFKDGSSNFWLAGKHYHLNEDNEIVICAGGDSDESEIEVLRAYIKRNRKNYAPREISPYINEKEYLEVFNFGKYNSRTVQDVFNQDPQYLKWLISKFDFGGKEELKKQITEILK